MKPFDEKIHSCTLDDVLDTVIANHKLGGTTWFVVNGSEPDHIVAKVQSAVEMISAHHSVVKSVVAVSDTAKYPHLNCHICKLATDVGVYIREWAQNALSTNQLTKVSCAFGLTRVDIPFSSIGNISRGNASYVYISNRITSDGGVITHAACASAGKDGTINYSECCDTDMLVCGSARLRVIKDKYESMLGSGYTENVEAGRTPHGIWVKCHTVLTPDDIYKLEHCL